MTATTAGREGSFARSVTILSAGTSPDPTAAIQKALVAKLTVENLDWTQGASPK